MANNCFVGQEQYKLNHQNYMTWRHLIRPILFGEDAYRIATGDETYPQGKLGIDNQATISTITRLGHSYVAPILRDT